jgi:quinol-cytochrome oxidoreductase complex cytochrome b subunit
MSFWGATVITGLVRVVPYGPEILIQIWGRFSLSTALLGRLFSLHFLLPLVIIACIVLHLILLHQYVSSSNTLGVGESFTQFYVKDRVTLLQLWLRIGVTLFTCAVVFMDADNWFHANPLATPAHIKPE